MRRDRGPVERRRLRTLPQHTKSSPHGAGLALSAMLASADGRRLNSQRLIPTASSLLIACVLVVVSSSTTGAASVMPGATQKLSPAQKTELHRFAVNRAPTGSERLPRRM